MITTIIDPRKKCDMDIDKVWKKTLRLIFNQTTHTHSWVHSSWNKQTEKNIKFNQSIYDKFWHLFGSLLWFWYATNTVPVWFYQFEKRNCQIILYLIEMWTTTENEILMDFHSDVDNNLRGVVVFFCWPTLIKKQFVTTTIVVTKRVFIQREKTRIFLWIIHWPK